MNAWEEKERERESGKNLSPSASQGILSCISLAFTSSCPPRGCLLLPHDCIVAVWFALPFVVAIFSSSYTFLCRCTRLIWRTGREKKKKSKSYSGQVTIGQFNQQTRSVCNKSSIPRRVIFISTYFSLSPCALFIRVHASTLVPFVSEVDSTKSPKKRMQCHCYFLGRQFNQRNEGRRKEKKRGKACFSFFFLSPFSTCMLSRLL